MGDPLRPDLVQTDTVQERQQELDLPKPFEVDEVQAEQLEKAAMESAGLSILGEPPTAIDKVFSNAPQNERIDWSKRAFCFSLSRAGASAFALGQSTFFEVVRTYATDRRTRGALSDEWGIGEEFEDRFIEFIECNRRKPGFRRFDEVFPHADKKTKFVVGLIKNFDEGGHADEESLAALVHLSNASRPSRVAWISPAGLAAPQHQTRTEVFLIDLIAAELVRLGRATWGKKFLETVKPSAVPASWQVPYMDKILSTNYTSLSPAQYLFPSAWGFDEGLRLFNGTIGDALNMKIASDEGKIIKLPNLKVQNVQSFAQELSAPGFYWLFWITQYAAAVATGNELKEIVSFQYELIKTFAPHFARAAWNSLFIAAMQLHRQGERELRDQFVAASLGFDSRFWRHDHVRKELITRINNYDAIPLCWFLFVNTIPELQSRMPGELSLLQIAHGRENAKPQLVRAAFDEIRKQAQENVTRGEALRDYLDGDQTLGIYLPSQEEIRNAIDRK